MQFRLANITSAVYKYTDMSDGIVKYVGIVHHGSLPTRHKQHMREDWYKQGNFLCEYIEVNNQSEAEAIESHLITLYETHKYYNRAKSDWGLNSYLPNEYDWKPIVPTYEEIVNQIQSHCSYAESKGYKDVSLKTIKDWLYSFRYTDCVNEFLSQRRGDSQSK